MVCTVARTFATAQFLSGCLFIVSLTGSIGSTFFTRDNERMVRAVPTQLGRPLAPSLISSDTLILKSLLVWMVSLSLTLLQISRRQRLRGRRRCRAVSVLVARSRARDELY